MSLSYLRVQSVIK